MGKKDESGKPIAPPPAAPAAPPAAEPKK
jgi:hypothetical protein